MTDKVRITLLPLNQSFEVEKESQLHDILFTYGVEFPCGGHARCMVQDGRGGFKEIHLRPFQTYRNLLREEETTM